MAGRVRMSPQMQEAFRRNLARYSGQGYVNPHRRASLDLVDEQRAEGQRMQRLESAGENARIQEQGLAQQRGIFRTSYDMDKYKLESDKRGMWWTLALGLGRMGLAGLDARKTQAETEKERKHARSKLIYEMSYLQRYDPQRFHKEINHPEMQEAMKKYGLKREWFLPKQYR